MAKLTCTEKEWDNVRPASVKKTGLGDAIAKALKSVPGGDSDKISTVAEGTKAKEAVTALQDVLGTAFAAVSKASDDKKGAASLLKAWRTEAGKVLEAIGERQQAIVEAIVDPVLKKWAAPRKDLEKKVIDITATVRHGDNNMGHSEQMREEAVMAMVQRAGTLRETGWQGTEPKAFLGDNEFKAMYETWDDMIELAIKATKELETAKQQSTQLQKIIGMMYKEIEAAAKEAGDGLKLVSPLIQQFNTFRKDAVEFYMESASEKAAKYATFAFIADVAPSSSLRDTEEKRLITRFNKVGKVNAEAYFENKLAVYGLNEDRLKKTVSSVRAAGEQITKFAIAARSGGDNAPQMIEHMKTLAKGLVDTNARLVKARNNMEVVQALSKDVNKDMKEQINKALQYVAKVTEDANEAVKEFA